MNANRVQMTYIATSFNSQY